MELVVGNKNLSSWSLRPWLVMAHLQIPFDETMIRLDVPGMHQAIREHSASGLVPCLKHGDSVIWDSLAIVEYLAEHYPDKGIWPSDASARARARCLVAEMHSGFSNLRSAWPMDVITQDAGVTCPAGVRKDLDRIFSLWEGARQDFGTGGDFLFGAFSAADAFYAPVVSRIRSYGPVASTPVVDAYGEAVWALPAFVQWRDGAHREAEQGWYS